MANIEPTPVTLDERHVADAAALVAEAGWNQTAEDWRLFLKAGQGIGYVAEGRLVASALALPYGPAFGWISMVLVTADYRRRGLARRLLSEAIALLEDAGRVAILDATPAGEALYRQIGFTPHFPLHRWQREAGAVAAPRAEAIRAAGPEDADAVIAYDREVFQGERGTILADILHRDSPHAMRRDGRGVALSRNGRISRQIGPILAGNAADARAMLETILAADDGPVFMDIPDHQTALTRTAAALGFTRQRPLLRMVRGPQRFADIDRLYALAGPELG